ncbi:MAG: class I SAM-dependent methyltransferase [Candidatus Dormibacteria bacterium]
MADMLALSRSLHVSASSACAALFGDVLETEIASWSDEFAAVWGDIIRRDAGGGAARDIWPKHCDMLREAALMLYCMARSKRPQVVVETGVAMGYSTSVLLAALSRNGSGDLYSTDVSADVGQVLSEQEQAGWHFWLLDRSNPAASLAGYLAKLGQIDLFLHDSMHTYEWQALECRLALAKMRTGAILASDDVDDSYGYMDICNEIGAPPVLLCDGRKVFGATVLT